jgi:hypothetical protein
VRFLVDEKQAQKNQAAIDLLDSWLGNGEDAAEHQRSWDFLKTALDEERLWRSHSRSNNHGDGDDCERSIYYSDSWIEILTNKVNNSDEILIIVNFFGRYFFSR